MPLYSKKGGRLVNAPAGNTVICYRFNSLDPKTITRAKEVFFKADIAYKYEMDCKNGFWFKSLERDRGKINWIIGYELGLGPNEGRIGFTCGERLFLQSVKKNK